MVAAPTRNRRVGREVHVGSNPTDGAILKKVVITVKHNIVVGLPIVEPWEVIAIDKEDFEKNEKQDTLFTSQRFLPAILVEAGIVKSNSEVKRNKPELCRVLNELDCFWVKWGKQKIYIVVGE